MAEASDSRAHPHGSPPLRTGLWMGVIEPCQVTGDNLAGDAVVECVIVNTDDFWSVGNIYEPRNMQFPVNSDGKINTSMGVTDTNTVDVTGYLGAIDIATRTPAVESPIGTPVDPSLTLTVHSEGVPIFGPTRQFDATGIAGDPTSAECIIMNETAYTQLMSDAGNIFVDGAGVVQWIVGIYGPQF